MKKENQKKVEYSEQFLKDVQDFANFAIKETKKDKRRTAILEKDAKKHNQ